MKVYKNKDIFILILLFPIFILLTLNGFNINNINNQPYSIYNADKQGMSIYYETLKELGYKPRLILKNIENTDNKSLNIVTSYSNGITIGIDDKEIKNWVEKGGKLILLTEDDSSQTIKWGDGEIKVLNIDLLVNEKIAIDKKPAFYLTKEIEKWDYNEIYFNEFYLYGTEKSKKSLWYDMPQIIRLILIQLFIFLVAIIFYKGKRFGKPIPLYQETERIENEYIYSVASLYQQGGFWKVVADNYYSDLLEEIGKDFCIDKAYVKENLIELWQKGNFKKLQKVKRLFEIMKYEDENLVNKKDKKYKEAILIIEEMKKILSKRREDRWKQIKIK